MERINLSNRLSVNIPDRSSSYNIVSRGLSYGSCGMRLYFASIVPLDLIQGVIIGLLLVAIVLGHYIRIGVQGRR